jgi:cysteine-S-conjugate beta-lyase
MKWDKYRERDVLPFWVADMDFRSPPCIEEALRERVAHGVYGYTLAYPTVVGAVLDYMRDTHGVEVAPEWLVWMPGLVPALNTASRAYEQPGDGVLTCTPVYPPFLLAPEWQNKQLITVPLVEEGGRYTFNWPALEAAVTPRTRMFILCNPHNPVGRAFDRQELERLMDFCERHDLLLISDEIHCDLLLNPGVTHHTVLALGERARKRTLTLMAPSKTFNIPGLSCSFIIIPDDGLRQRFQRASRGMVTEINLFGYVGCEAAYRHGMPWLAALRGVLRANRDRLYEVVSDRMPRVRMLPMEATYLAWMDMRPLGLANPLQWFEQHGIGLSDGTLFGGPGFLRFNFGCPAAHMERGLERLVRAYEAIDHG